MKTLCKITMTAGIILILATAGASDLNTISIPQIIKQIVIGLILIVCGLGGVKLIEVLKDYRQLKILLNRQNKAMR